MTFLIYKNYKAAQNWEGRKDFKKISLSLTIFSPKRGEIKPRQQIQYSMLIRTVNDSNLDIVRDWSLSGPPFGAPSSQFRNEASDQLFFHLDRVSQVLPNPVGQYAVEQATDETTPEFPFLRLKGWDAGQSQTQDLVNTFVNWISSQVGSEYLRMASGLPAIEHWYVFALTFEKNWRQSRNHSAKTRCAEETAWFCEKTRKKTA